MKHGLPKDLKTVPDVDRKKFITEFEISPVMPNIKTEIQRLANSLDAVLKKDWVDHTDSQLLWTVRQQLSIFTKQ